MPVSPSSGDWIQIAKFDSGDKLTMTTGERPWRPLQIRSDVDPCLLALWLTLMGGHEATRRRIMADQTRPTKPDRAADRHSRAQRDADSNKTANLAFSKTCTKGSRYCRHTNFLSLLAPHSCTNL